MTSLFSRVRINRFVTDVMALFSSRILVTGISIVSGILLGRFLGPEKNGIVTAVMVIPNIISNFADLGLKQATTYFMGKKIYPDQDIVSTVSLLFVWTSFSSVLIVALIYFVIGDVNKYGWILIIPPIIMLVQLSISYSNGVLLAKQHIRQTGLASILSESVKLALIPSILLIPKFGVVTVLIGQLISSLIVAGYLIRIVRKYAALRPAYFPGLPLTLLKRGVVYAIALFILSLNYRVDIVIMGRLATARDVGVYSVGVSLAELLWWLPAAFTTVNFARSSAALDPLAYARKTAVVLRVVMLVSLLPVAVLFVIAPWLITLLYGNAYSLSGPVVQAILPGIWFGLIFKILNSDLAGRGRPAAALWVYGLAVVVNIILNIWWIPLYGPVGSSWASSVSYTLGALIFAVVYARMSSLRLRELFVPTLSDFKRFVQ